MPTTPTGLSAVVAERELRAILGAHRQRKDVPNFAAVTSNEAKVSNAPVQSAVPTFHPKAVDSRLNKQWNEFVNDNKAMRLHISMYIVFLVVINNLQRYNSQIYCPVRRITLCYGIFHLFD